MKKTLLAIAVAVAGLLPSQAQLIPAEKAERNIADGLISQIELPGGKKIVLPARSLATPTANQPASNPAAPALKEFRAEPAAARVRRSEEASATEWSQWRYYTAGSLSLNGSEVIYEWLYGEGSFPERITVERRDDLNDPTRAQLRFVDFFPDRELIMDYDLTEGMVTWEPIDLGRRFPDSDFGYDVVFKHAYVSQYFHVKRTFTTGVWFMVNPDLGYSLNLTFVPDTKADVRLQAEFTQESVNSPEATVTFPEIAGDIVKVKYTVINAINSSWYDPANPNEALDIFKMLDDDSQAIDIRTLTPAQAESYSETVTFEKGGPWTLFIASYDQEGDRIDYRAYRLYTALPEEGKWTSIGKGIFTDFGIQSQIEYMRGYNNLVFPEWADTRSWQVDIEESTTTPGLYRVVNPYGSACPYTDFTFSGTWQPPYEDTTTYYEVTFDREHDYYMVIHTEDPDCPWTECTPAGFSVKNWQEGGMASEVASYQYVYDYPEGAIAAYHNPAVAHTYTNLSFSNLLIKNPAYSHGFRLALPGYVDYEFTIAADNKGVSITNVGEGVSRIDYLVAPYYSIDVTEAYETIRNGGEGVHSTTAYGSLNLDELELEDNRRYSIYAVSFDAAGEPREQTWTSFALHARTYYFYCPVQFTEPFFGNILAVDLLTSPDAPGHFFIHNPFEAFSQLDMYDLSRDVYMDIDCANPYRVKFDAFPTGLIYNGEELLFSSTAYILEQSYAPEELSDANYGTLEWGDIDFGTQGTAYSAPELTDGYWQRTGNLCVITGLPGYTDERFTLREAGYDFELCDFHKDVTTIAYTVCDAELIPEEYLADRLSRDDFEGLIKMTATSEGILDLSAWTFESMHNYVIGAVSYRSIDGAPRYVQTLTFQSEPIYELLGTATVTDAHIANILPDTPAAIEIQAEVYTIKEIPGHFYIRNLFESHYTVVDETQLFFEGDFSRARYTEIDCSDPQRVVMPLSFTGLYYKGEEVYTTSTNADGGNYGDAHFGTFDGKTITIPSRAVITPIGTTTYGGRENASDFVVELPNDLTGIRDITTDSSADAPVEYFDILGRPVERPVHGAVYIVRQGNSVTKQLR